MFTQDVLRSLVRDQTSRRAVPLNAVHKLRERENADDMVGAIVSRLTSDIMGSGLQLSYNEFGSARDVGTQEQREFADSWDGFARELTRHLLIYGWAVVRRPKRFTQESGKRKAAYESTADDDDDGGGEMSTPRVDAMLGGYGAGTTTAARSTAAEVATAVEAMNTGASDDEADVPFVLPPWIYSLEWQDSSDNPRRYVAIDLNKRVMTNVAILVHCKLDDFTGEPTSPTARLMKLLQQRSDLLRDVHYAAHWAARTTWALQTTGMSATPDPNDIDQWAEGAIRDDQIVYERHVREVQTQSFATAVGEVRSVLDAQKGARMAASGMVAHAAALSPDAPENQLPFERTLVLGPGKQIASTPAPTVPAVLIETLAEINNSIFNVFGVPPELLAGTGKRFASEGEQNMRLYESKLAETQSAIENYLTRVYNTLYDDKFIDYARYVDQLLRSDAGTVPTGGATFMGAPDSSDAAASPPNAPRPSRRAVVSEVRKGVKARITIVRRSFASVETIMTLQTAMYISESNAAMLAVTAAGVSSRYVMTDKEREKVRQKTLDDQMDELARSSDIQADAKIKAGGSLGAAPKKKAASSSSSASSAPKRKKPSTE